MSQVRIRWTVLYFVVDRFHSPNTTLFLVFVDFLDCVLFFFFNERNVEKTSV